MVGRSKGMAIGRSDQINKQGGLTSGEDQINKREGSEGRSW